MAKGGEVFYPARIKVICYPKGRLHVIRILVFLFSRVGCLPNLGGIQQRSHFGRWLQEFRLIHRGPFIGGQGEQHSLHAI